MYVSSRSRAVRLTALCALAFPTLLTGATTVFAQTAQTKSAAPPKAKISAKQAEAAALKKISGKVKSSVYELEDGHWQYAVIVTNKKGKMVEVAVDPTTGKVLSTENTSGAEEAREAVADKKAAAGVTAAPKKVSEDKEKDDEKDEKESK